MTDWRPLDLSNIDTQNLRVDRAMLHSISTWFRMRADGYQGPHSFNDLDVAEMLGRIETALNPGLIIYD